MSHAIVRGKPTASQVYLDGVLDSILREQGVTPDPSRRELVTLPQIMFHCLKKRPQDLFMINGATGVKVTNEQVLKRAVSLSRALTAQGARGKHALLLMRNHEDMTAVYFGVMFAGLIPFMMDPNCTVYELTHFLKLIEPSVVFCDLEFQEPLQASRQSYEDPNMSVVTVDIPGALEQFVDGHSDDFHSFQVSSVSVDDPVMFLPTSGSTGMPKAAIMTHRGLVAQLPIPWSYQSRFPTPTDRVMILTTIQWMTFSMFLTASVAYHIPVVMSPRKVTAEHVVEIMEKHRPTWSFLAPAFAVSLVQLVRPDQISSMETLILLGAPATPELMDSLKEKLPKTAHLCDGYGTTETQGFIAMPDREAPCNGWVVNIFHYKIVDEQGQQLGANENGELWVKGPSVIKGYHKNDTSYDETFTPDGWYRTGDKFHLREDQRLAFLDRIKFSFKYRGAHVSPEEVERVICAVPGVQESVICASDDGPVAAVVLEPSADVTREQIHKAVDSALSDHKRLHGGIAFVTSLPHTHSGKLKRNECSQLIASLRKSGKCY